MKNSFVPSICCLIMLFVGVVTGAFVTLDIRRDMEIERGCAEWVCDPKTGETTFTWLVTKKEE